MHLTNLDQNTNNTQSLHFHSVLKNTSLNGISTQVLKRHDGNFLNADYEYIHNIDL